MLLETHSLRKEYRRGGGPFAAVDDVTVSIGKGEYCTITGKSGSGKTTLLTMLAGLTSPSSGAVVYRGHDFGALGDAKLSQLRNKEISYIPQGASLLGNFTAFDNIRMPQVFAGKGGEASDRALFLMEAMGLLHLRDMYPRNLSGGEMRRIAIARALFNNPVLLLADEPTSDLDPENAQAVMDLFASANAQGTAVLIVTHEERIAAHGRRRFCMETGMLRGIEPFHFEKV